MLIKQNNYVMTHFWDVGLGMMWGVSCGLFITFFQRKNSVKFLRAKYQKLFKNNRRFDVCMSK